MALLDEETVQFWREFFEWYFGTWRLIILYRVDQVTGYLRAIRVRQDTVSGPLHYKPKKRPFRACLR